MRVCDAEPDVMYVVVYEHPELGPVRSRAWKAGADVGGRRAGRWYVPVAETWRGAAGERERKPGFAEIGRPVRITGWDEGAWRGEGAESTMRCAVFVWADYEAAGGAGDFIGFFEVNDPLDEAEMRKTFAEQIEDPGGGQYRLQLVSPETMSEIATYEFSTGKFELGRYVDKETGYHVFPEIERKYPRRLTT